MMWRLQCVVMGRPIDGRLYINFSVIFFQLGLGVRLQTRLLGNDHSLLWCCYLWHEAIVSIVVWWHFEGRDGHQADKSESHACFANPFEPYRILLSNVARNGFHSI